jgi:hypothetical protein
LKLTERNIVLDILCLVLGLGVVPRRVLVCLSVHVERVVRRRALPRTNGSQRRRLQDRLVFDGGWGKIDVAFDGLVGVRFGDDGVGYAGCCGHLGGDAGGEWVGGLGVDVAGSKVRVLVEGCERGYRDPIYTMCSSLSAEGKTQQNAYQLVLLAQNKLWACIPKLH